MRPAIKKSFDLMGDDIAELSTESGILKNQIGDYDDNWLGESKAKLLKQVDDDKKTKLFMSRLQKPMKKHLKNGLYILY